MDESASEIILQCLPLILLVVMIAYSLSWISKHLLPRNIWLRRGVKTFLRLVLVEPVRLPYRALRWLAIQIFNTRPDYTLNRFELDPCAVTPLEFYRMVSQGLRAQQNTDVEIAFVTRLEWHLFSTRRIYLHVRFREAVCFISALTFATGLYVTWRFSTTPSKHLMILYRVPYVGAVLENLLAPQTFYRTDIYQAFAQVVRSQITEAATLVTEYGIDPPGEGHPRLLQEFYR